jgi:hypothetical protein
VALLRFQPGVGHVGRTGGGRGGQVVTDMVKID